MPFSAVLSPMEYLLILRWRGGVCRIFNSVLKLSAWEGSIGWWNSPYWLIGFDRLIAKKRQFSTRAFSCCRWEIRNKGPISSKGVTSFKHELIGNTGIRSQRFTPHQIICECPGPRNSLAAYRVKRTWRQLFGVVNNQVSSSCITSMTAIHCLK